MRENVRSKGSWFEILLVSTKLGITSFGGPVAHLGYFREEYVVRRKWLGEQAYADLVALCQFLPGPASSQVGIGIGLMRGGWLGAVAAWLGFTLPSVLLLVLFAFALQAYPAEGTGWLHGLKLAAVAIVAQAVWGMGKSLAPDRPRALIAVVTAIVTLLAPYAYAQVLLIAAAGALGFALLKVRAPEAAEPLRVTVSRRAGAAALALFAALLAVLPLARAGSNSELLALFDSFYRAGALVFGGGHVVLPLLEREVVPAGWATPAQFVAGYAAAQAVPGPLFTFAAYLGVVARGVPGAVAATLGIFLPAFLLVVGALPFWNALRSKPGMRSALAGINAAVVGILLAALYNPVWTSAVHAPSDVALALAAFGALVYGKLPPWAVVGLAALAGMALG
ncbi:chromate efflux transporter [Paenibacillus hamazuiensis]|uniref:chromate efflux transporter n=1 Tax=Paenibacillus hamazuiensis TaxID=2936508 RepID=UPI0020103F14|nr:chromate efflux transporter [Paenibacillus hamazuiensis]